jgi:hypothetical protein
MLDAHPELAIPGETHFLMALWTRRRGYQAEGRLDAEALVRDLMRSHQFRYWELPEEMVWRRVRALRDPTFADAVGAVYMAYADANGKRRWGDKTPQYVRSIPELSAIFPGSRFIHVIRDGRDVALSYLSLEWGPSTLTRAVRQWRGDVAAGRAAGRALGDARYLEIRYEDLVRDPADALARACAFQNLTFEPAMLEYHREADRRIEARPDRTRAHAAATRPPEEGLRDWRTQMSQDQVMTFESMAGGLLSELGYERRFPRIPLARRASDAVRSRLVKPHMPRRPQIRPEPRRRPTSPGRDGRPGAEGTTDR